MRGRFEKGDIIILKPEVRPLFRFPARKGIVRFAYDHEPAAYDVEFYRCGRSLGNYR